MNDYNKYQDGRWRVRRLLVLHRDGYKCTKCGITEHLRVHHKLYYGWMKIWEYPNEYLVTVCEGCHEEIHLNNPISSFISQSPIKVERVKKHLVDLYELVGEEQFKEWLSNKDDVLKQKLIEAKSRDKSQKKIAALQGLFISYNGIPNDFYPPMTDGKRGDKKFRISLISNLNRYLSDFRVKVKIDEP